MLYKVLLIPILIVLCTCILASPGHTQAEQHNHGLFRASVQDIEILADPTTPPKLPGDEAHQIVTVKVIGSTYDGLLLRIPHVVINQPGYNIKLRIGDEVIIYAEPDGSSLKNYYITDYARDKKVLYLILLFIFLLLLLGGNKGLRTIISLLITGGAVYFILLPALFDGYDPLTITIIVSGIVTMIALPMITGLSKKTLAAILGTIGGVVAAGILAYATGTAAHLTGFSDEEMHLLLFVPQQLNLNYQGILFAGMIIGALGAVMDVGMSVASAVEEIKRANPLLGARALIRAGMNVGRDTMGTMANTLILAYTGGSIPLMLVLMAYNTPLLKVINMDLIATEVVRAIAGSIGLILAIPITAVVAGLLFGTVRREQRFD